MVLVFNFALRNLDKDFEIGLRISCLEIFSKKYLKKLVIKKRIYTFAPAQRDKRQNKEEYVPRHIELTAVLEEILKQKKESKRVERFEQRLANRLKYEAEFRFSITIYDEEFDPGSG